MALIAEVVPVGPRIQGLDTVSKLSADLARVFAGLGCAYAMRYVDLVEGTTPLTLDAREVADIVRPDFALMVLQFARSSGWSSATGKNDGAACARNMLSLNLDPEAGATCDLEGKFQSKAQAIDYGSAWWESAAAEGLDRDAMQAYIGDGNPLNGQELFQDLPFRGYMRAGSPVPEVAHRSYRMIQVAPLDQVVAGIRVDFSFVTTDAKGSRPRWIRATVGNTP